MRILYTVALLVIPYLAAAQSSASVESLAGCYELRVSGWHLFGEPERLPRQFELTTRRSRYSSSNENLLLPQNLDPKVRWNWSVLASWIAKDDRSLEINWSTGFVGWEIHLSRSGRDFQGRAHYFTDTDSDFPKALTTHNSLPVVVRKMECKADKR